MRGFRVNLCLILLLAAGTIAASTTAPNCDVTSDGNTNIADAQRVINEALGVASADHDVNGDGVVNAGDIQIVVNAASGFGCTVHNAPGILDFNPKSGPPGTLVSVAGSNFGATPQILISQQGGGTLSPSPVSASDTAVSFVVPPGAATGPIQIVGASVTFTSSQAFTVTPSGSFTLNAVPPSANLIQGQSISYAVSLGGASGFDQLAQLSVSGVPSGVTAVFRQPSIAAGQTSVLTLTAPANQSLGTATLTVSAAATVDGLPVTASASPSLSVVAPTTTLLGRTVVADPIETPLAGVTVSTLGKDGNGSNTLCTGHTTVSDATGNFALTNLPAGCAGPQLIAFDGTTATSPSGKYAGVNLVFTMVANQVTASPVLVHLPRIDTVETFLVAQNAASDQSHNFTSIPGLSVTVYAGTVFTMPDGSKPNPFPLAAVQVPVDRLPDAKPNVPTMVRVFIVAFQPANAAASQPVAVSFPNVTNTPPGTMMPLMTLDPTHGTMVPYGTGTVSDDGTQVIPDPDPAHPGHRYGLVHFDWHGQMPPPPNQNNPAPGSSGNGGGHGGGSGGGGNGGGPNCGGGGGSGGTPGSPCKQGTPPSGGEPVDLASGIHVLTATDIAVHGGRGSIAIHRVYRTMTANDGPFGIGIQFDYGILLDSGSPNTVASLNLIEPDGNRFLFSRQSDGTLRNTSIPSLQGAVMTTNANGQTSLRYPGGTVYQFQPSAGISALSSITDRYGNTTSFTETQILPSLLRITQITDPVGRSLTLTYDAVGHVISVGDPTGRVVTYTYNSSGTLASVTDPAGGVTRYQYDSQNRIQSMTDARGVVMFVNSYDANGRVSQQQLPDGGMVQFAYTLANPLAPASPVIATTFTDALGHQTLYRFNVQGFLTDVTDARGQTKTFVRDAGTNQLLQVTGTAQCAVCGAPGEGPMTYTYDAQGNRVSATDALGNTTRYTYDPASNQIASIIDALNHTQTYQYDNLGNLKSLADQNGHATTYTYDSFGQPLTITDAQGNKTSIAYDAAENPVSATDPLGNTTTRTFDSLSRPVAIVDPMGLKTTIHYDQLDRVTSTTDAMSNTTQFQYDAIGNLVSLRDPRNHLTTFTYDSLSRPAGSTNPLGKSVSYQYDLAGNVTRVTDRRGQATTFQYDAINRLTSASYQDGSTVARTYVPYGRLLTVNDSAGGVFSYSYDAAGRLLAQNQPNGSVTYTRDALARVATRQVVGQSAVTYTYDAAGNLLEASMPGADAAFTYNERNLATGIARSNGVNSALTFDGVGHVLSLIHSKASTARNTQTYAYDAHGDSIAVTNDISQPLTTAVTTATVDASNELLTNGQATYSYDDNGNRLTESGPGGTLTYSWDSRNRLASIVDNSGKRTSFRYDFGHNLLEIDRTSGTPATQKFVLDNLENVVSLTGASGLPASQLTGRVIDSQFASIDTGGNVTFGIGDPLGTIVATTDATGNIVNTLDYEPYGKSSASGTASYPFTYTGRVPVLGNILYFRNRFYDAGAGRFLSQDPVGFAGGDTNLYGYASANPVNGRDPTGLANDSGQGTTLGGGVGAFGGLGGEAGYELVHLDNCTCQRYVYIGAGAGFGGFGGGFQGGGVNNVFDPSDYAGGFITLSGAGGIGGGSASIGTPCFPGLGCQNNSQGEVAPSAAVTVGPGLGAGAAFTARYYWAVGPPFDCGQ